MVIEIYHAHIDLCLIQLPHQTLECFLVYTLFERPKTETRSDFKKAYIKEVRVI